MLKQPTAGVRQLEIGGWVLRWKLGLGAWNF